MPSGVSCVEFGATDPSLRVWGLPCPALAVRLCTLGCTCGTARRFHSAPFFGRRWSCLVSGPCHHFAWADVLRAHTCFLSFTTRAGDNSLAKRRRRHPNSVKLGALPTPQRSNWRWRGLRTSSWRSLGGSSSSGARLHSDTSAWLDPLVPRRPVPHTVS
jgi:hypothetical protein